MNMNANMNEREHKSIHPIRQKWVSVVTLGPKGQKIYVGKQYNIGEKPTVMLYTWTISRHAQVNTKTEVGGKSQR